MVPRHLLIMRGVDPRPSPFIEIQVTRRLGMVSSTPEDRHDNRQNLYPPVRPILSLFHSRPGVVLSRPQLLQDREDNPRSTRVSVVTLGSIDSILVHPETKVSPPLPLLIPPPMSRLSPPPLRELLTSLVLPKQSLHRQTRPRSPLNDVSAPQDCREVLP